MILLRIARKGRQRSEPRLAEWAGCWDRNCHRKPNKGWRGRSMGISWSVICVWRWLEELVPHSSFSKCAWLIKKGREATVYAQNISIVPDITSSPGVCFRNCWEMPRPPGVLHVWAEANQSVDKQTLMGFSLMSSITDLYICPPYLQRLTFVNECQLKPTNCCASKSGRLCGVHLYEA